MNVFYHRIIKDVRHREPAIVSHDEIDVRLYGEWQMGLVANVNVNRQIFLKYALDAEFNPYNVRPRAQESLFAGQVEQARVLSG